MKNVVNIVGHLYIIVFCNYRCNHFYLFVFSFNVFSTIIPFKSTPKQCTLTSSTLLPTYILWKCVFCTHIFFQVPTSIAFRPMGRAATEAFLNECEGGDPLGKKQAEHLDRLFVRVDEVASKHPPTATAIKMGYAEPVANLPSAPTVVDVGDDGKYYKSERESALRIWKSNCS